MMFNLTPEYGVFLAEAALYHVLVLVFFTRDAYRPREALRERHCQRDQ
jgi:hypothetical protein